ncbi:MAG: DUF4397 domain-containing protein, partial [Sphingobacteriaceae bacterium]
MKFRAPLFILLVMAVLSSCQKDDLPPAVSPTTRLFVVNASGEIFNIFQNGNRLNNDASLYPNGVFGYINIIAGQQNFQFKRMGSPDVSVAMPLTLDTLKSYSLYVTGLTTDEMFLLNDDFTADTGSVSMIRFVNASPETSNMDLVLRNVIAKADTVAKSQTDTISNIAFKSNSAFKAFVSGDVQVRIFKAGALNALTT